MEKEFLFKLKALMLFRVIIISVFLGIVILFEIRLGAHEIIAPIPFLIGFTYLITLFYSLLIPYIKHLGFFAYVQIIIDLFIETGIIFITGGIGSPFSFLYILSTIAGSTLLFRPGGYVIASISSLLYGILTNLELYNIVNPLHVYSLPSSEYSPLYVFYHTLLNIAAFYFVAYLSGYLSESLRKTGKALEVKNEDLLQLKTFHENVVENMGNGLIASDINGLILSVNKAAEKILGFSQQELIRTNVFNLFSLLKVPLCENLPCKTEDYFTKKNGFQIFLAVTQSLLKDSSANTRGYIFVFQDLTEMKVMEKKVINSERQAALGRVASGIAHEIRNPLASLSGSIQLLKNKLSLSLRDKRLMEIIIRETERLNNIITDFLQYASPQKINREHFDLGELIDETVTLLRNHPDLSKGISIVLSNCDRKMSVNADPKQIRQVLWNLCLNAIQAMQNGGKLEINAKYSTEETVDEAEINIIDNGEGINSEDIPKIFEPFYTTKERGTGLGLSTVQRIIQDHNGRININSIKNRGTTVTLYFPVSDEIEDGVA